jgi:hypothetical protein
MDQAALHQRRLAMDREKRELAQKHMRELVPLAAQMHQEQLQHERHIRRMVLQAIATSYEQQSRDTAAVMLALIRQLGGH